MDSQLTVRVMSVPYQTRIINRLRDDLAFISCTIRTNESSGLGAEALDLKKLERVAAAYLAEHLGIPEGIVRHDAVTMLILGESKALIRYHMNALSEASNDLG